MAIDDDKVGSVIERYGFRFLSTVAMGFIAWYLNDLNSSIKSLNDAVVEIRIQNGATAVTINNMKYGIDNMSMINKDLSKSISELNRTSAHHEQQIRQLAR